MTRMGSPIIKVLAVPVYIFVISLCFILTSCTAGNARQTVVIYTSVDQVFSEPVLKEFQEKTGIEVLPVYDVEASKSTGLANRLIAEKRKPQADVFWSGEFVQTIMLKSNNILTPYQSPAVKDISAVYKDTEGFWTGIGGRARVLLINTEKMKYSEYPKSIFDLLDKKYAGSEIGMAYPLFGTAVDHAAALYAGLGREKAKYFYTALKDKGVRIVDGNSVVRDMVANGQLSMGLLDTDDALSAKENGKPVELVFPDQEKGGMGTLVIPNTIALVAGSPHPAAGKALIDFLLSREIEKELYDSGWIDFTLRSLEGVTPRIDVERLVQMNIGFDEIYKQLDLANKDMQEIFVK